MPIKIAIVGKPNVGKSTLFNKLCGKRLAITDDRPGVTRDVKTHAVELGRLKFELMDTAGLEYGKGSSHLASSMTEFSLSAASQADIILFLLDAKHGVTPEDYEFSKRLRKFGKKVIVVANKAEGKKAVEVNELFKLGFGEAVFIAAEHRLGFIDLEQAIRDAAAEIELSTNDEDDPAESPEDVLRLAFIGRPNVGKSSIFNKMLGFERNLVSDASGTTRDAISDYLEYDGRKIELIDTAGMRKKNKVIELLENLSTTESINALRRCHIVVLVIDATEVLDKQELRLLRLALEEGRGLVLVINKIDKIPDFKAYQKELTETIDIDIFGLDGVEVIYVSALTGKNIKRILPAVFKVERTWKKTVSTSKLNKWLADATSSHIPPIATNGRRIRLKYATQTAIKPPTFTIFANMPSAIAESYTRYLVGSLRHSLGFMGVPIRIRYKKIDNPYDK